MWVTLVASLAINLLVVGVIIGAGIFRRHFDGPTANSLGPGLVRYGLANSNTRGETRRILMSERDRILPLRRDLREARRGAVDALLAKPFDPARFRAAQASVNAMERRLGEESLDAVTAIAGTLSAEQRREFVDRRLSKRRYHRSRDGEGSDEPAEQSK
jgi:uncharacterized membrane protein